MASLSEHMSISAVYLHFNKDKMPLFSQSLNQLKSSDVTENQMSRLKESLEITHKSEDMP